MLARAPPTRISTESPSLLKLSRPRTGALPAHVVKVKLAVRATTSPPCGEHDGDDPSAMGDGGGGGAGRGDGDGGDGGGGEDGSGNGDGGGTGGRDDGVGGDGG
eukprot:4377704-Pleurochrysis_carterae.AAC.1